MVNTKDLTMLANYVLVLPDPQVSTYQVKGKELGLISPDFKYEKGERIQISERNASVFGTVYGVPTSLSFNREQIKKIAKQNTLFANINGEKTPINISIHRELGDLTRNSVLFDVDIEIQKGDRVNFSYQAHKISKENQMVIETELGEMYLIKYDMLYMVVDENLKPKRMLNGYVLVEPEEIEVLKEGSKEFIERKSGLVLLAPKEKIKKTRKSVTGTVKLAGSMCRGYLQEEEKSDLKVKLNPEDKIMYDPRKCQKLEYDTHQIMSDKVLHLVQRKDIYTKFGEEFDYSKLELGRKKDGGSK